MSESTGDNYLRKNKIKQRRDSNDETDTCMCARKGRECLYIPMQCMCSLANTGDPSLNCHTAVVYENVTLLFIWSIFWLAVTMGSAHRLQGNFQAQIAL